MIQDVMLGQWLPDLADYKNPGVVTCDNCYPTPGGYAPIPGLVSTGDSVTGEVRGARRFERYDGTAVTIIGTTTDLFVKVGGSVIASSLSLTLATGVVWSFEQFNKQIWAFAYGQDPHYLTDIDTDTSFSAHPGTAPQAASVRRVGDFLVTANMVDIDASTQPYRLRWSQFNNPAGDYGTDLGTQTGFVDVDQSFGAVVGVFGGRNDVVLQKSGVSRMSYTGGATVFRLDTIEEERGCISQASAVTVGTTVYFLAEDGFCRCDGASVEVISTGRVFEWFLENSNSALLSTVQAVINWKLRCVIWSFVPKTGTTKSRQIIYSWDQDRWSTASITADWLFETTSGATTMEELAVLYPNLDTAPLSLDSLEYQADARGLAAFVGTDLNTLTGDNLAGEWETGDFQPQPGYRTVTDAIYPLVENQDANTVFAVGARPTYKGEAIDWSDDTAVDVGGYAPITKDGRYLRARMRIPAAAVWDKAIGMQVSYGIGGRT